MNSMLHLQNWSHTADELDSCEFKAGYAWGITGGIQLVLLPHDPFAQELALDFESGPGSHPKTCKVSRLR
jgi:hypothetical protein